MGFSIGRLFAPIEEAMRAYCEVESLYLPIANYSPMGLLKNMRAAIKRCRSTKYDIVHITGAEHYLLLPLRSENCVVTLHDLGFYTMQPQSLKLYFKYCLWIKTLPLAKRVICISDKSRQEAEGFVRFREGQSLVIYNPVDTLFQRNLKEPNVDCPTILHIGTTPNKNLDRTIMAIKDIPCRLRVIGRLSNRNLLLLKRYNINYSSGENLTDLEIIQEYEMCDIVNFPSLYEGFGMPIIEGQSVGRVVVTSDLSPMREVAGGGAILVDPNSIDSITSGYKMVKESYKKYVELGFENVKRFQLDKVTSQYYRVYKDVIYENSPLHT